MKTSSLTEMTYSRFFHCLFAAFTFASGSLVAYAQETPELPTSQALLPPTYELTDRNFVNVGGGNVNITLQDVAIGQGQLGLSHHIATQTGEFINYESFWGPVDKYRGGLMLKHYYSRGYEGVADDIFIAQYFDFQGSLDFQINYDGTFTPLNDQLSSLVYANGLYTVTKPDGTVAEVPGNLELLESNTHFNATAGYTRLISPNGFIINVIRENTAIDSNILSVTTNNGLQLKYVYDMGYRHLPAGKDKTLISPANMPKDGLDWSAQMPASVSAVNRGYQYCGDAGDCNGLNLWPTATYHWPAGMPKAAYVDKSIFSVTDAAGRTTEYHHTPFDIKSGLPDIAAQELGKQYVVRLEKVKLAGESVSSVSWTYANAFTLSAPDEACPICVRVVNETSAAVVNTAVSKGRTWQYNVQGFGRKYTAKLDQWEHYSAGHKAVERYAFDKYYNVPVKVELWDKDVYFDTPSETVYPVSSDAGRYKARIAPILNRVKRIEHKRGKGATEYEYDARGNLTKIWRSDRGHGSQNEGNYLYVEEAMYPINCPNPKTCNKPRWVKDGRGNATSYTYHAQSGQIATVLKPADNAGHRAKIRYGYTQKYAWYKNSSGTLVRADTPIWLLTSEKQCRIGATLPDDSGCVTEGAEIVTTYYYGTEDGSKANNLWMTGYTVTADGQSRTTCYTHDKLGNTLSETQPNAGLSSCP